MTKPLPTLLGDAVIAGLAGCVGTKSRKAAEHPTDR